MHRGSIELRWTAERWLGIMPRLTLLRWNFLKNKEAFQNLPGVGLRSSHFQDDRKII